MLLRYLVKPVAHLSWLKLQLLSEIRGLEVRVAPVPLPFPADRDGRQAAR